MDYTASYFILFVTIWNLFIPSVSFSSSRLHGLKKHNRLINPLIVRKTLEERKMEKPMALPAENFHSHGNSPPRISTTKTVTKAIYCTGAGIYCFWQWGAIKYLKEYFDIDSLQVMGASAGSLTGSLIVTNASLTTALETALELAIDYGVYSKQLGLAGIWGNILREWLDINIPQEISQAQLSRLNIALTPPFSKSKLVSGFASRQDLIDACMASCHVPVFLDGRPLTIYRGEPAIDGSFWYFVLKTKKGLPLRDNMTLDEVFWVDYSDDDDFISSISGNFLEVATPKQAIEMFEFGYRFMEKQHNKGKIPLTPLAELELFNDNTTTEMDKNTQAHDIGNDAAAKKRKSLFDTLQGIKNALFLLQPPVTEGIDMDAASVPTTPSISQVFNSDTFKSSIRKESLTIPFVAALLCHANNIIF